MGHRKQKQSPLLLNKNTILLLIAAVLGNFQTAAQCLSSVNPVGGTENLLLLEKKSLRVITFYKHSMGKQYYEGDHHADFNLIDRAFYNNLTYFMGYGLNNKLALETELGYFINKTQVYNTEPEYRLRGYGVSNLVISTRYGLYAENFKRVFITLAVGLKIPTSRNPMSVDHVELPVEVQPTMGSYGLVMNTTWVKENSGQGLRFFLTNRIEYHFENNNEYKPGTAIYTSGYISKHIMANRVKGDWTTILQLRNEIRTHDEIAGKTKESSGSVLFFVVPQINYVIRENWNLSALLDIPVYQYFNGTQLGAGVGITFSMARSFDLHH